jgi:bifunctional non-homologous end joining protein LigD
VSTSKTSSSLLRIESQTLAISNAEKILFPHDAVSKGDLIAYYRAVAPFLLPYVKGRPLSLERFPNGLGGESWWEKHKPKGLPDWVPTVTIASSTDAHAPIDFIVCNDEATLVYVANLAAIVLHVWHSHMPDLDTPDFILIDLDPHRCTLATLARVALTFRDELLAIGLDPLVKTTGGKGLHVVIPLEARYDYDHAKAFAELIARRVHGLIPELTTFERSIAKRPIGTVLLDYVQVGKGKTWVAPFSVRARDGAPVSMPIGWDVVEGMRRKRATTTEPEMLRWSIANVPTLLANGGDPWAEGWRPQRLEGALSQARSLWG